MFEHKGSLLNFSPEQYINGKGEKFKLVICQRGKFSEVEQSCDAVVFIHFCEGSRVEGMTLTSCFQYVKM